MIYISGASEKNIRLEGEKAYPNECCGILLGIVDEAGNKKLERILPIHNSREEGEQYHRFLITSEDMVKAEMKARGLKLDIVGFYHSHPDHPAEPSEYDKEHALPFYSYIIVAIKEGTSSNLTSWELLDDRTAFIFEEVKERVM